MSGRRAIAPLLRVQQVHPGDTELLERCRGTIEAIRFDATALPVDALSFEAREDGIGLVVDVRVPDRDEPEQVVWIHVWRTLLCPWAVLRLNGPDYLVRWLRETVSSTLAHEVDESIALHGVRVFDPHKPLT